jgi:hypothetical protein
MTKLKDLFQYAYNKGRSVQEQQQAGEVVDGRQIWGNIEVLVKDIKLDEELRYRDKLNKIYTKMDKIDTKFDMTANEFAPASNHFFLQLRNLVKAKSNFIIALNRILQLAFNAGQLSIFIEREKVDESIVKLYNKYKLYKLKTYVSKDDIRILNKYTRDVQIPQSGGGIDYKAKYLKYKQKYLNLKLK